MINHCHDSLRALTFKVCFSHFTCLSFCNLFIHVPVKQPVFFSRIVACYNKSSFMPVNIAVASLVKCACVGVF